MLCPRCGTRQPLGSARCSNCGAPFTRREAAKRSASSRAAVATSPAQSYRRYERRSGVRRSLIAWLSVVTIVVIAVVALAALLSSSVLKPYVDKQVDGNVQAAVSTAVASVPTPAPSDSQQVAGASQLVITQQEINDQIARSANSFGPVSGVEVQINSDQFIVNFKAYGLSGRYTGQVAMRNGQPVLTNGHVSGPLGMFVSTSTVENALNRQIAAQVAMRGVQVSSVALQPGKMVLTLSS
jgi:hypothetical protein